METQEQSIDPTKQSFFQSLQPKTAFIFGAVSATALLSIVALAIAVPLALKGGTGKVAGATVGANTNAAAAPTGTADISKVSTDGVPFSGDAKAPVVLAVWEDFQCPFCKRWEQDTLPTLLTNYVAKGKLKIVYKDFSFLGTDSDTAAVIARAVWDVAPKKYEEWRDALFAKQDDENAGWGKKEDILALTKTISGIDADKVAKLADQNATKYTQAIAADKTEGGNMGVNGTPGFIIGTQIISGAQPAATFTAAIDAELAKK